MKSTIKLFLIVALFVSTAFAEGDMGSGGKTCTTNCLSENQTGESNDENLDLEESDESVLTIIQDYLNTIFG